MRNLLVGMLEWRLRARPLLKDKFAKLALGQKPDVLFVGCSDSRVAVNVFASTRPGETFVIRNVGNLVPPNVETEIDTQKGPVGSALEFGINALGVHNVIVCGHSECGAMNAVYHHHHLNEKPEGKALTPGEFFCNKDHVHTPFCNHDEPKGLVHGMTSLTSWLKFGGPSANLWKSGVRINGNEHLSPINQFSQLNVVQQLNHIKSYDVVKKKLEEKKISLHGWWFDIGSAAVYAYNPEANRFNVIDLKEANRIVASMGQPPLDKELSEALRGETDDLGQLMARA